MVKIFASIFMISILLFGTLSIPNLAFSEEGYGQLVPEKIDHPGFVGLQNSEINQLPPLYPPGLEKAGFTRVISSAISDGEISDIKQKGCTVINKLNHATSFFCPSEIVDTMDNVRPVRMYQIQDLEQSTQIQADRVWNMGITGGGFNSPWPITVAILDTGVQADHEELIDSVFNTQDFTGDPFCPNGDWLDCSGHGTHVSGIITGNGKYFIGNTGNKATGVAPGADIMAGKVCTVFSGCPEDAIIGGLEYAAGQAEVINMSLGGGLSTEANCDNDGDPIVDKVNELAAAGTVIVIASGNDGSSNSVTYPGCASGAIAVGAVDGNDNLASFSNKGPAVDIVAPGVDTLSTWSCNDVYNDLDCASPWYTYASGTSMATPHVAGVVALILDNNPDWTVDQVKEALYTTAIDLPGTGDGHGRVDAFAAVNYDFTTVSDTTPPVLTIPSDINTPTDPGLSTAVVSFSASANDDVDGPITPTCEPASGSVFLLGSTLVTCNATDTAGNSAEDSFTVTVEDKEAPLVIVPADITTDSDNSVVTFSVTADDNVDGALTPTCSPPSGTDFPIGETTVTCNATDTAGNTGVNSFTVTVTDNSAPTPTIHVGDLDYETSGKKNWKGKVTIFVHDENEGPIANALVQGVWNDAGVLISADCTTDNTGYCQVNESTRENLMIFTVTEVIAEGYDYLSSANHDDLSDNDDGNGTSITVEKGGSSGDSGGDSGGDNGGGVCAKNPEHKNC